MPNQTKRIISELGETIEGFIISLTKEVARTLEEDTPELTGFAETNWVPAIGGARSEPSGSRQDVDFNALESGLAVVEAAYKFPQTIYISNPVSYISTLNAGSSTKAPKDFVQTAIAKAIKSVI